MLQISNFKDIILSKAGGKPLGKIPNFYSMLFQAMTELRSKTDIPSSIRTTQLTNPIYSDVDTYPLPIDVTLGGIINLRPITADDSFYDFNRLGQRQYKVEQKYNVANRYATRNINGVQYLMLNNTTTSPTIINTCDSLTANGTVGLFGLATNLLSDSLQKVAGIASISFQANIGASNGIQITGMTAINASSLNDFLAYVYLPTLTNVTGVRLSYGQSASAYYTASIATDFFGNALSLGWNLIKIPKTSFGVGAGSPNWTSVTFLRAEILGTFATAVDGFRFDAFSVQSGSLYEIDYYSNYQFQSMAGTRLDKPTADTDYIIVTDDELSLFLGFFLEIMSVDLKQSGAVIDVQEYGGARLIEKTAEFKIKFPSQRQLPTTNYGYRPYIK